MSSRRYYYTLVASLPYLPRFDRAQRLPINRDRLLGRLKMLEPRDAEIVNRVGAFLGWEPRPVAGTGGEIEAEFRQIGQLMENRWLAPLMEFPIAQRTIMAALRQRRRGRKMGTDRTSALSPFLSGERWGIGLLVKQIERNWGVPDFKLGITYPWVAQAHAYLEADETLALERLLMGLTWDRMSRLTEGHEFELETVLAYLFKWDILQRWLSYRKENAKARFGGLLLEVIGEHNQFFA